MKIRANKVSGYEVKVGNVFVSMQFLPGYPYVSQEFFYKLRQKPKGLFDREEAKQAYAEFGGQILKIESWDEYKLEEVYRNDN